MIIQMVLREIDVLMISLARLNWRSLGGVFWSMVVVMVCCHGGWVEETRKRVGRLMEGGLFDFVCTAFGGPARKTTFWLYYLAVSGC